MTRERTFADPLGVRLPVGLDAAIRDEARRRGVVPGVLARLLIERGWAVERNIPMKLKTEGNPTDVMASVPQVAPDPNTATTGDGLQAVEVHPAVGHKHRPMKSVGQLAYCGCGARRRSGTTEWLESVKE